MKIIAKMLIILVIIAPFCVSASASEADKYIEEFGEILPDGYEQIGDEPSELIEKIGFGSLVVEIGAVLEGERGEIVSFFLLLIGSAALVGLSSLVGGRLSRYTAVGVGLVISLTVFSRLYSVFLEMSLALESLSKFFGAFIPVTLAVSAASGGSATASVGAVGMNLTLSLVGGVGTRFFVALAGFSFAMSMLSALGNEGISALLRSVKGIFMWVLGIVTALLAGTFALQTVLASATDSAAMRAARYMASGLIPVVGSTVSGALSTLVSGMSYVKGVIGVGAVYVILSMALAPLVLLLLYRLALSLSVSFLELLGVGAAREPFTALRHSLDCLIATYAVSVLVYVFEIILFVKGGVGA